MINFIVVLQGHDVRMNILIIFLINNTSVTIWFDLANHKLLYFGFF